MGDSCSVPAPPTEWTRATFELYGGQMTFYAQLRRFAVAA